MGGGQRGERQRHGDNQLCSDGVGMPEDFLVHL